MLAIRSVAYRKNLFPLVPFTHDIAFFHCVLADACLNVLVGNEAGDGEGNMFVLCLNLGDKCFVRFTHLLHFYLPSFKFVDLICNGFEGIS